MDIVTIAVYSVECPHIPTYQALLKIILSLDNWQNLAFLAKQRHEKRLNSINWRQPKLQKKVLLVLAAVTLLIVTAYPLGMSSTTSSQSAISVAIHRISPASSTPTATIYLNPQTIPIQGVGTSFTIQVKVENMGQFNGWDIQITSSVPPVINATSLSISGNIFAVNTTGGSPFEIVHCVNGVGTGCTSADGQGVVHSAFGDTAFTSGNGLLFTITYQVTAAFSSSIVVQNSLISSSSPSGVPHVNLNAVYGTAASFGSSGGKLPLAS